VVGLDSVITVVLLSNHLISFSLEIAQLPLLDRKEKRT